MEGIREFVHRLAPGLKNCMKIVPIENAWESRFGNGSEF